MLPPAYRSLFTIWGGFLQTSASMKKRDLGMLFRSVVGGALMGLANLVPGVSGGTMLLASGVYPQFISGVAEVVTFRFRAATLLLLACVVGAAAAAIVGLAGVVSELVIHQRWIMYSLFLGLTLGGVPVLWRMIKPADSVAVFCALGGIAVMAAVSLVEPAASADSGGAAYAILFIAGLVAGAAMILPGISGSYLLLILGQYVTILSAISAARQAVGARDIAALLETMHVIVPVGLGVLVGVVGVSNLIKILLARLKRPTLGVLLGLLLGAGIGLWPFVHAVPPQVGSAFRGDRVVAIDGQLVLQRTGRVIESKHWPTERFTPTVMQVGGAAGLLLAGLLISLLIGRLGANTDSE
jgi:putative membrane protein